MNHRGHLSISMERRTVSITRVPTKENKESFTTPPPGQLRAASSNLSMDESDVPGAYAIRMHRQAEQMSQEEQQFQRDDSTAIIFETSTQSLQSEVELHQFTDEPTQLQANESGFTVPTVLESYASTTARTIETKHATPVEIDKKQTSQRCQQWQIVTLIFAFVTLVGGGIGVFLAITKHSTEVTKLSPTDQCDFTTVIDPSPVLQCTCQLQITVTSAVAKSLYSEFKSSNLFSEYNGSEQACQPENIALWWIAMDVAASKSAGTFQVHDNTSLENQIFKQRYGLALFYLNLEGWSSEYSNWLQKGESECDWQGISCNNSTKIVTGIKIVDIALTGELPGTPLLFLPTLTSLVISNNNIKGGVPVEVTTLVDLETLDLSFNQFHGSIPGGIRYLTALTSLTLEHNKLTGSLPNSLYSLTPLINLNIAWNQLSGPFSHNFGQLSNLKSLAINGNSFSGALPSTLGFLTMLQVLNVGNNNINGTLPSEIGLLFNHLKLIDAESNSLTGTLPTWLVDLGELSTLALPSNQFTGTLPAEFGNFTKLEVLDLSNNKLSGTLPPLSQLYDLRLGKNSFSGTAPADYCSIDIVLLPCIVECTCCTSGDGAPMVCEESGLSVYGSQ